MSTTVPDGGMNLTHVRHLERDTRLERAAQVIRDRLIRLDRDESLELARAAIRAYEGI